VKIADFIIKMFNSGADVEYIVRLRYE
jgi:hypothetical protein